LNTEDSSVCRLQCFLVTE